MNGGADLGGMMGFGPVNEEQNEPLFHAVWEGRALGMTIALGACCQWNLDMSRFARESMQPAEYMQTPTIKFGWNLLSD
ncbi:SH3-like domain-containing protein [Pseudovibrio sp. Tun.PSC04-5.I4]|uniref:SH3-like domain-containing protein n=1 Tax=Pseudovibrio sp. Tun.PSC04-5.I4 TaxID=1798213 RepID=UPI000B2838EE